MSSPKRSGSSLLPSPQVQKRRYGHEKLTARSPYTQIKTTASAFAPAGTDVPAATESRALFPFPAEHVLPESGAGC